MRIHVPTLLMQGTVDTLFTLREAVDNYEVLRRAGVPLKMLWLCGGHRACLTSPGDLAALPRPDVAWLTRCLAGDRSVDTGPGFEWVGQEGPAYSAPSYPPAPGAPLLGSGSGTLGLADGGGSGPAAYSGGPDPTAFVGAAFAATKAQNAVDVTIPAAASGDRRRDGHARRDVHARAGRPDDRLQPAAFHGRRHVLLGPRRAADGRAVGADRQPPGLGPLRERARGPVPRPAALVRPGPQRARPPSTAGSSGACAPVGPPCASTCVDARGAGDGPAGLPAAVRSHDRRHPALPPLRAAALFALAALLGGCGSRHAEAPLPAGARPHGAGPAFHPPVRAGRVPGCRALLGARTAAHVELFAADRVVLVAAGIGTDPPREVLAGRITRARCYGPVATLDPTGLVLVRRGARATVAELFRAWGQPLGPRRLAGFRGTVRAYLGGRPWHGAPGAIPLRRRAEVVLEVGPYVPPHAAYSFPSPY